MDLSIVTTLYQSSPYLQEFYQRVKKAAESLTPNYEIIFINDGSPDRSLESAVDIQRADSHVVVIDLSRNFGHHRALMTGLAYARGSKIFLIDSDLEEQPEWLPLFDQTLRDASCDVVYGLQSKRKGDWTERISGAVFYKLFNSLSRTPVPPNATTARLMTDRYKNAFLEHHEREVFLPGLWQLTGFRQMPVEVIKGSKGSSTYSLSRKISLCVNAVTSFSDKPLVYIFYTGTLICLAASAYILRLLVRKWFWGIPLMGWPSLIVSIWFLGGLTIFFIGVLGIYLSKVYVEIKHRPTVIVRQVYSAENIAPPRGGQ